MAKWEQLSDSEKIEDLRRDLLTMMAFVNQMKARADALEARVSASSDQIRDLESKVAKKLASKSKR
jgi:small-conductance mechanosensitive channel